MTLRDYIAIALERIVVVIAVVVVTTGAVIGLLLVQDPTYTGTVRLRARPPAPGGAVSEIAAEQQQQTDLGTEAELVRSSDVATEVAQELGLSGKPDDLLDRVSAVPVGRTAVLQINANAPTEQEAVALANAFASKYLKVRRERLSTDLDAEADKQAALLAKYIEQLAAIDRVIARSDPGSAEAISAQAERDRTVAEQTVARARLEALADRAAVAAGFGEIIQPATDAGASRSQSLPRAAVFGLLLGIPLALASVLVLDGLSNDVRSRQDVERAAKADLIGVIPIDADWHEPAAPRLVTSSEPLSATAEAYKSLSFTLARYAEVAGATSVLITSPGDGDGKTVTVANLAIALADAGRRVRVVEADLRHPRLHTFFAAPSAPGVADLLAGQVDLADALIELGHGLEFIPAGRPSDRPDLLMARGDLRPIIKSVGPAGQVRPIRARSARPKNLVLIDSAPILEAGEVARLAAQADAVVLVVRARTTSKQALSATAEQVRRVGGTVLGVVLIGLRSIAESGTIDEERIPVIPQHPQRQVGTGGGD